VCRRTKLRSAAAFAAVFACSPERPSAGSTTWARSIRRCCAGHATITSAKVKIHSHARAGYSIQLPPRWEAVEVDGLTGFRELGRKRQVVARLTIVPSDGGRPRATPDSAMRFIRDGHVLTFWTSRRRAARSRVFEEAAESFRTIGSA
jgi:hypothetical protein